jgi:hypothetical protein
VRPSSEDFDIFQRCPVIYSQNTGIAGIDLIGLENNCLSVIGWLFCRFLAKEQLIF